MKALVKMGWLVLFAAAAGCEHAAPPHAEMPPPEVEVSKPVVREVTDYEETTGRTDSYEFVQLRARVSGYLKKIKFTDGDDVKAGQVLFEIDNTPYKAQFDQDLADLANKKAALIKAKKIFDRTLSLRPSGGSTQEDVDNQGGDYEIARAAHGKAEAKVRDSKQMLDWAEVKAPISGRTSRKLITEGNLVKVDDTILTTIVSLDRIFVYLFVDERTLLRMRTEARISPLNPQGKVSVIAEIGLAYEEGYSLKGEINFEDNTVDPGTGTKLLRAELKNFKAKDRQWFLSPGLFARVRVPIGGPKRAVLVADRALSSDQGKKFLYVVADKLDDKTGKTRPTVERRYVHTGGLHGGLREILMRADNKELPVNEKLSGDEWVIVSGLQHVQPGFAVETKFVEMPTTK